MTWEASTHVSQSVQFPTVQDILSCYKNSNLNYYYTEIFNYLAEKKIYANFIDVSKLNWKEIDTKKDFIQAKKIYKRILNEEKK